MISTRKRVLDSWVHAAPSIRGLGDVLEQAPPLSLRGLIDRLALVEELTIETDIHTDDEVPIGGHVKFTLRSDGSYTFAGKMEARGIPSYHYGLQAWVGSSDGTVIAGQHEGDVYGDDTPGPDVDEWSEDGVNLSIKLHWASLRAGGNSIGYKLNADMSGVLGTAADVLTFAMEAIAVAYSTGVVGEILFIGSKLGDLGANLGTPDVLAGMLVAGGVLYVMGPAGVIPAVIAGGVTIELANVKHRSLTNEERDFAWPVFMDSIDYDRIALTNLSHDNGRKYVMPSLGGTILMNMNDAFDDPRRYTSPKYPKRGEVFIHELTHAWQVCNDSWQGLICGMSDNYEYGGSETNRSGGWSSREWGTFNNEQQAHIVDDWYAMNTTVQADGTRVTDLNGFQAQNDRAYRFIRDHIRTRTP